MIFKKKIEKNNDFIYVIYKVRKNKFYIKFIIINNFSQTCKLLHNAFLLYLFIIICVNLLSFNVYIELTNYYNYYSGTFKIFLFYYYCPDY